MRILVLSWRDQKHPLAGGAEQVINEHIKGWIAAGHEVTHFSSNIPGKANEEVTDGIKIIRRGYQYWGVQFAAFWYYLKNNDKYDFLVDEFHGIPFFTPLYSSKPKVAVVQEVARKIWLKNPLPKPMNWIIGLIGYAGEPILYFPYFNTKFITGSQSAKEDLKKYFIRENNISVINHGVIIEKPNKKTNKEKEARRLKR